MDPDSFAMSSYQFVNSLASCYPQSQLAQQQQQQQQHSQHPATAGNQTTAASDYFANPTYNPNLYSPHYANQNYLATQQQQQQAASAADMVDYTQLQPQRMMLGGSGGGGGAVPGPQQAQSQSAQPGGVHPAAVVTANSCKYAATGNESGATTLGNNTSTTGPIASPQDLSTARELVSPKLSPNSVQDNLKGRTINNNNNNNSNPTTNLSLHSPTGDSDSDSDSGAEENEGSGGAARGGKKGSGSGPPTVYPWMKRVHLGQSE